MADPTTNDPRPAGWRKDPSGRHFGRYWDGQGWTDHVISAEKVQSVDPLAEQSLFAEAPPPAPAPASAPAVTYKGPAPTAPGYVPEPKRSKRSKRDGGVKVWKIALGVTLGLFLFMGVCVALIAGGTDKAAKKVESADTSPSTSPSTSPTPFVSTQATKTTTAAPAQEASLGESFTVTPGDRRITAFTFKSPVTSSNQFTKAEGRDGVCRRGGSGVRRPDRREVQSEPFNSRSWRRHR